MVLKPLDRCVTMYPKYKRATYVCATISITCECAGIDRRASGVNHAEDAGDYIRQASGSAWILRPLLADTIARVDLVTLEVLVLQALPFSHFCINKL